MACFSEHWSALDLVQAGPEEARFSGAEDFPVAEEASEAEDLVEAASPAVEVDSVEAAVQADGREGQ